MLENTNGIHLIRYSKLCNHFEIGRIDYNNTNFENEIFFYDELKNFFTQEILQEAVKRNNNTSVMITSGAPGDPVWTDMKSIHRIQYQQRNKLFCLLFGLSSALFYLK